MIQQIRLLVLGRVQNVGYRYFTRKTAIKLGISGSVRNLPDGNVEIVAQGTPEQLEILKEELLRGPISAKVSKITCLDQTADIAQSYEFIILH
jgi:acylphosphatase